MEADAIKKIQKKFLNAAYILHYISILSSDKAKENQNQRTDKYFQKKKNKREFLPGAKYLRKNCSECKEENRG